jgi:hypothetical protein
VHECNCVLALPIRVWSTSEGKDTSANALSS